MCTRNVWARETCAKSFKLAACMRLREGGGGVKNEYIKWLFFFFGFWLKTKYALTSWFSRTRFGGSRPYYFQRLSFGNRAKTQKSFPYTISTDSTPVLFPRPSPLSHQPHPPTGSWVINDNSPLTFRLKTYSDAPTDAHTCTVKYLMPKNKRARSPPAIIRTFRRTERVL